MTVTVFTLLLLAVALIVVTAITIAGFKHLAHLYYEAQTISTREHQFSLLVLGVIFIAFIAAIGMIAGFVVGA